MAEPKENYWSKHFTGITQCFLGFYCCVFATIGYFYPRAAPQAQTSASTNTGGAIVHSSYSMPFWLWIGIISLALSVIIPAIVGMIRKRRAPDEMQRLKDSLYDSARSNLEYRGERDRCEEDKRVLQKRFDDLFTPVQIEAFELAKDIREFLIGLGSRPELDRSLQDDTPEGIERSLNDLYKRRQPWDDRLTHGYQLRFPERVARIKHLFGESGLTSRAFDDIEHMGITNVATIPRLVREIDRLALEINYGSLPPDAPETIK